MYDIIASLTCYVSALCLNVVCCHSLETDSWERFLHVKAGQLYLVRCDCCSMFSSQCIVWVLLFVSASWAAIHTMVIQSSACLDQIFMTVVRSAPSHLSAPPEQWLGTVFSLAARRASLMSFSRCFARKTRHRVLTWHCP